MGERRQVLVARPRFAQLADDVQRTSRETSRASGSIVLRCGIRASDLPLNLPFDVPLRTAVNPVGLSPRARSVVAGLLNQ